jgi:ribosome maturation factor RimP
LESIEKVEGIVREKVSSLGYELYSFALRGAGNSKRLEITVDRVEPIDLNAITELSDVLSALLDEHEFTEGTYTLDISSLGAEKPIKVNKLESYVGQYVNLHVKNPIDGESYFEGTLESVDDKEVTIFFKIKTRTKKLTIERSSLDKARLAIKF